MSILIREASLPKSCNECKLDLRTDIYQAFCEWNAEHPYSIRTTDRLPDCPLSEAPEPCEDTISRQTAIDAVYKCTDIFINNLPVMVDKADAYKALAELPSTRPERKKGKWNCGDDMFEYAICSACKWDSGEAWEYAKKHFRYCPNCGAEMREEQE